MVINARKLNPRIQTLVAALHHSRNRFLRGDSVYRFLWPLLVATIFVTFALQHEADALGTAFQEILERKGKVAGLEHSFPAANLDEFRAEKGNIHWRIGSDCVRGPSQDRHLIEVTVPSESIATNESFVRESIEYWRKSYVTGCEQFTKLTGDLTIVIKTSQRVVQTAVFTEANKYEPTKQPSVARSSSDSAPGSEVLRLPDGKQSLVLLGRDEDTLVRYWRLGTKAGDKCWPTGQNRSAVIAEMPANIRIEKEETAKIEMRKAVHLAQSICGKCNYLDVWIIPATEGHRAAINLRPIAAAGAIQCKDMSFSSYQNRATEEFTRQAAQDAAAAAANQKATAAHERWTAFAAKTGVSKVASAAEVHRNPFLFENQIIGLVVSFKRMVSAEQGFFDAGERPIVVSGLPKTRFGAFAGSILLAGKVIGTTTDDALPHLSYVDAVDCTEPGCGDIVGR